MELDIILAADTDVIKTYVHLEMGDGIIAGMAYDPAMDHDLVARDLSHLIPSSRTKIAYLKTITCLYTRSTSSTSCRLRQKNCVPPRSHYHKVKLKMVMVV